MSTSSGRLVSYSLSVYLGRHIVHSCTPFTVETVNLFEGENFEKNFLNLNPAGTLPTLITPEGDSLDNTIVRKRARTRDGPAAR